MPADAAAQDGWQRVVQWTGGQWRPAARAADSRLTEVLVHHVDLRAGFTPEHWPAAFAEGMLARVVAAFSVRSDAPAVRLRATDTETSYEIGNAVGAPVVEGRQAWLLAWLMGRSEGDHLRTEGDKRMPVMPALY